MSIITKLRHWFTPHHTNNFRAKLLHNSGIFAIIGIVLVGNLFLRLLDNPALHILGFTSSVTIDEVVRSTNETRAAQGLKALSYNEKLADAARHKAANMFEENYWAHYSPSGKSPWVWFNAAGYNYVYAGENLAKDFGSTPRLMQAWMDSPTHRDNIVNSKYSEIGIAVVPGTLQGEETVLVVQLFGTPSRGSIPKKAITQATPVPVQVPVQVAEVKGQETIEIISQPKLNEFNITRALNLGTTALFILILIIDFYLAESQKLTRRVGNNWAHILFINLILLATVIVNAGKIM